ncbi:sensor histidine kinase [Amycolatopsis sp. YIM 10]|uniref:sensor histidine kinase n=1 Tax=Amycolatopsis sp. YIM 10 TaxID=2653857 RepID=UPI00129023FC|nr:histidine kinase [Amycolatopsis sp. YIM 10]QFU90820.1 Nitrate/nitrite sensor protein NarX [Amycolatopsis sp. YIM 10]
MRRLLSWVRARPVVTDWFIIGLLVLFSLPAVVLSPYADWAVRLFSVLLILPVPFRRTHPVPATAFGLAVFAAQIAFSDLRDALLPANVALLALVYALAVYGPRRALWPLVGVTVVLSALWSLRLAGLTKGMPILLGVLLVCLIATLAVADGVSVRLQQLGEARDRAREAQEKRDALARAAVAEERARIAREMHDVVAHAVSTMVMQSEGARLLGRQDPDAVDEALRAISGTGREAIGELRRVLGVLRENEAEASTEPQPGPGALAGLAEQTTAAGVATRLDVLGSADGVPPGAAMTVHRVVQEALTNVLRYAPSGARCAVTVDFGEPGEAREIRVSVVNDNGYGVAREQPVGGGGYGVLGMRERVAMFGGELTAEPATGGGFRVTARLPLEDR